MESNRNGEYELGVIKMFHDEAYSVIDQGLSLEENNRGDEVRSTYENGVRLLEQALSVRCDHGTDVGENWDKARFLQMKMRKTREDVLSRLSVLVKERPDICCTYPDEMMSSSEMPPSYEEACVDVVNPSTTCSSEKKSFQGICQDFPGPADQTCQGIPPEARSIFTIANGVQIFFVSGNGDVSAPSYPTVLNIYKIHELSPSNNLHVPPAFLRVGEWVYPLIPGRIPVLHTTYGAYMLPDVNSSIPGSAIGLVLTDSVSQQDRQIFEHLLCELTVVQTEIIETSSESSERRMSTKISNGIVTGAEMLSKGMLYGAEKTSEYIKLAANKLRENIEPARSPTNVDSNVQKGLHIAKSVTSTAVKVSGYLVNQLGRATMALGQHLAPHVRKHGTNLLAKAFGEQEQHKADQTMDGILEVAGGGLKGFSTMYLGLQESAKILANSLISETVTTVHHKYGPDAATSTDDGLRAVGNVAYTTHNISHLGIKAIAKKTATDTGKALILQKQNENKKM